MKVKILIPVIIIIVVVSFVNLHDRSYTLKIKVNPLPSPINICTEAQRKREEWGEAHYTKWDDVRFLKRKDGIFDSIASNKNHPRSLSRMWMRHPTRFTKQILGMKQAEFDLIGPVTYDCPLKTFGKGDEEKRVCWQKMFMNPECTVFSLGSNNQWTFEEDVLKKTKCKVYTFDCTVKNPNPPPGVHFYSICVGKISYIDTETGYIFKTIDDILRLVLVAQPTYLKIDIEGCEFETLIPYLRGLALPPQIAIEIHYQAPTFDLDETALLAFGNFMFYEAGYVIAHRRDNWMGYFASEFLFVKINCAVNN